MNIKQLIQTLVGSIRLQYVVFALTLMLPNILMTFTEPQPWYTNVAQLLFGIGLFFSLMLLGKKPGRQYYVLFLFVFFGAFQCVLLWLYGNSPISVDMFLNLAATNANEAGELLGNIIGGVIIFCSLYILMLVWAATSWNKKKLFDDRLRHRMRRLYFLPLLVGSTVLCVGLQIFTPFRFAADVYPINVTYNAGMAICRYWQLMRYDANSQDFTFNAVSSRDATEAETYVFIIGETTRSISLGLYGYERNTTPRLSARQGLITYRDVLSQSNTTHKSVPLLLTAAEAIDPSPMYDERSLIAAFHEAGFYTAYISNQANNGSLIDHYSCEADMRHYIREDHPDRLPDDADMLTAMREALDASASHPKRLFVLHLYGSHFKYCDRIPDTFPKEFQPCGDVMLAARNHDELINAFDNTMLYTDMVVDSLIAMTDGDVPAMVLFTSDHGEDIYDDERENFLHASPVVSFYQLAVPFTIWTNAAFNKTHPEKVGMLMANREQPLSPGRVVFHTLLDAAGIECQSLQRDHSLCDSAYVPGERLFLSDRNEPLRLDQLHLTDNDFRLMREFGISFRE